MTEPPVGVRHALLATDLGELTVTADGKSLTGLYFEGHWYPPPESSLGPQVDAAGDAVLGQTQTQLGEYLAGRRRAFDLPLATRGDGFSERVWSVLQRIPYGETTTYGAIAEQLGKRSLAQRVGQAVGHNPISIVIPCHRVVGADGSLTGFAGGLDRKRRLLDLEEPAHKRAERLF